jgi:hypothetical protein
LSIEIRTDKEGKQVREMPFELVQLGDLLGHEMTIDVELGQLIAGVLNTSTLDWPILVDEKTNLILDGHHRTEGLIALNYTNIPAILIDYRDDDLIKIGTWYPLVECKLDDIIDVLKNNGFDIEEVDNKEFEIKDIDSRRITALIGNDKKLFRVQGEREDIFQFVRDSWLRRVKYYDDPNMCLANADKKHTAIISWAYTKDEVINHVKNGKIFLPKTTRHQLKYEVKRCDFSIKDLTKNV